MGYMDVYNEWLSNPYFDEDTKAELRAIKDDDNEIKERFYTNLAFGTAGLRGVLGAGINRMNIYVVRRATQGLANYILKQGRKDNRVAIAYDSRHMSPEFADESARVLAANGITAYKFESLRPTPSCPSPYANLAVLQVSTSPPATTRRSTTATRYTGKTARSSPRRMTQALPLKFSPSRTCPR